MGVSCVLKLDGRTYIISPYAGSLQQKREGGNLLEKIIGRCREDYPSIAPVFRIFSLIFELGLIYSLTSNLEITSNPDYRFAYDQEWNDSQNITIR
jgi:hypothetical protein